MSCIAIYTQPEMEYFGSYDQLNKYITVKENNVFYFIFLAILPHIAHLKEMGKSHSGKHELKKGNLREVPAFLIYLFFLQVYFSPNYYKLMH